MPCAPDRIVEVSRHLASEVSRSGAIHARRSASAPALSSMPASLTRRLFCVVRNAGRCGTASRKGVGKVSFCLSKAQAEFGVFYHQQCIAFAHRLVFFEINLLDKTLHTGIDGRNMLTHLRIIGIFHAQMNEARANVNQSHGKQGNHYGIINLFFSLSCKA